jgi:hypothetical protein
MLRRMMRGLVCRAAEGDLEAVEALRQLEADVPAFLRQSVAATRKHAGYSWADVAPVLGTTRTTASERFRTAEAPPLYFAACGRAFATPVSMNAHEWNCTTCAGWRTPPGLVERPA